MWVGGGGHTPHLSSAWTYTCACALRSTCFVKGCLVSIINRHVSQSTVIQPAVDTTSVWDVVEIDVVWDSPTYNIFRQPPTGFWILLLGHTCGWPHLHAHASTCVKSLLGCLIAPSPRASCLTRTRFVVASGKLDAHFELKAIFPAAIDPRGQPRWTRLEIRP